MIYNFFQGIIIQIMSMINKVTLIAGGVAIFYNLLSHLLASMFYRDLIYEDKLKKSTVFVFITGVLAVVLSKWLPNKRTLLNKPGVTKGLFFGGLGLVATAFMVNWKNMEDGMKLFGIIAILGIFIWLANKKDKDVDNKETTKTNKTNTKELSEEEQLVKDLLDEN